MLAINEDDELDEASITGFEAEAQSLLCANTAHDQLLQVRLGGGDMGRDCLGGGGWHGSSRC